MNYEQRDSYGIYKNLGQNAPGPDAHHGPGPDVMGAETLIGNDVCDPKGESLGDSKEIMLGVAHKTGIPKMCLEPLSGRLSQVVRFHPP